MSQLKSLKNPCPPGCIPRSQMGLKLRETHYILGKDDSESTTEYRYEYNPKKVNLGSTVSYLYETQSYIFTLSNDGIVSAIKDDKLVWNYDLQTNLVSSPFIYASRIYVVSSYKNLYGFEFNL